MSYLGGGLCLTAPEILQNHANEPIRQLCFTSVAQLLMAITTNKDESISAHVNAFNSTQALQTRL